ncbi:MAG: hypothetical protein ACKE9I_01065 [Methylophagaceae bacterium]
MMTQLRLLLFLNLVFYSIHSAAFEQLIDPTMPANLNVKTPYIAPIVKTDSSPKWSLESTLISPYQMIAIINGKHLTIGDEINGATLVKIDHQQVELLAQNELIVLSLERSFISQLQPTPIKE